MQPCECIFDLFYFASSAFSQIDNFLCYFLSSVFVITHTEVRTLAPLLLNSIVVYLIHTSFHWWWCMSVCVCDIPRTLHFSVSTFRSNLLCVPDLWMSCHFFHFPLHSLRRVFVGGSALDLISSSVPVFSLATHTYVLAVFLPVRVHSLVCR